MTPNYHTTVKELIKKGYLNARAFNTCIANGIENLRDLEMAFDPEYEFLYFRNCGQKTNKQLMDVLEMVHSGSTERRIAGYIAALPAAVVDMFIKTIDEIFPEDSTGEEAELFHRIFIPELYIYELYMLEKDILEFNGKDPFHGVSLPENICVIKLYNLRKALIKTLERVLEKMTGNYDNGIRRERGMLKKIHYDMVRFFNARYVQEYYEALLSPEKIELANREFERIVSQSPRAVQNFMRRKGLDIDYVWMQLNTPPEEFLRFWASSRKGAQGFLEIITKFRAYLDKLYVSSEDDDRLTRLHNVFEFLTDEEAEYASTFMKEHGHLPMFFITDRYFASAKPRQHQIFARCYGLGGRTARRKTEVADELGMSRERVRQIVTESNYSKYAFADPKYWTDYPYHSRQFMSSRTKGWDHDMAIEGVTPEFTAFAGVMVAVFGFTFRRLAGVDKFVVVPRQVERYGAYLRKMLNMRDRTHVDNILMHLSDFLEEEDRHDDVVAATVREELARYLEIETIGNNLFFPHNSVDVAAEVEAILRKEGNPLHVDEILERMQAAFPSLNLTRDKLKFQMRSSDEIVPKGKTSLYCLRSWSHVFIGSIRDLVKQTLAASDTPLSIDEIMVTVSENFDTTHYNVYNSLLVSNDFTLYEGKRFGLSSKEYPSFALYSGPANTKPFSERFSDYRRFVSEHGRHPFNSKDPEEDVLKRWQSNVLKVTARISQEERKEFREYMKETAHLPYTHSEHKFKTNCEAMSEAVRKHGRIPSTKEAPDLVRWYKKTLSERLRLTGRKRSYFYELVDELEKLSPRLFSYIQFSS